MANMVNGVIRSTIEEHVAKFLQVIGYNVKNQTMSLSITKRIWMKEKLRRISYQP